MNELKRTHHRDEEPNRDNVHHGPRPYWKRAHRDWRFWVAVVLMFAAMIIYVMSDDLAGWTHSQPQRPASTDVGK